MTKSANDFYARLRAIAILETIWLKMDQNRIDELKKAASSISSAALTGGDRAEKNAFDGKAATTLTIRDILFKG